MTRLETLVALKAAVEAGVRPAQDGSCYKLFGDAWVHVYDIYSNGSLDAAKALHEAVLPGLPVKIVDHSQDHMGAHGWYVFVNWPHTLRMPHYTAPGPFSHRGIADNPARAWLLAILSALIAMETDRDRTE